MAQLKEIKDIDEIETRLMNTAKKSKLQPDALRALIAMTIAPQQPFGDVDINTLAKILKINRLRLEKHCESLLSKGYLNHGITTLVGTVYFITRKGKEFLLKSNLV